MIAYYGFAVRLFACIFIFGLIIFVILGIIGIAQFLSKYEPNTGLNRAARILDRRFARGEITQNEYRKMKEELRSSL